MSGLVVAPFTVRVTGWDEMTYFARSRGQALAKVWGDYRAHEDISFKDFLGKVRARKAEPVGRFGEPIKVGGQDAFYVSHNGQYVQFVRPGCDAILNSHPLDVSPTPPSTGAEK